MRRTTEWTCDICNKTVTIQSTKDSDGTKMPYGWMKAYIGFGFLGEKMWNTRDVYSCGECRDNFMKISETCSPQDEVTTRDEFKKSFWQKLFRGKTTQKSGEKE